MSALSSTVDGLGPTSSTLQDIVHNLMFKSTTLPMSLAFLGIKHQQVEVPVPNFVLLMAGMSCSFHLWGRFRSILNNCSCWFWSFFNSQKFLQPFSDKYPVSQQQSPSRGAQQQQVPSSGPAQEIPAETSQKAYAVINGAGNKAGKSFALYLMAKGFNLILIERDVEILELLEQNLRKQLPDRNPIIVHVVINKFDQESISYATQKYQAFPVKIFVNCKSSKNAMTKRQIDQKELMERQKALLSETQMTINSEVREILAGEEELSANFTTRAEVHFTGKENIEGYASLVLIFLKTMLMSSKNPCLINVDNIDKSSKILDTQIFYHATLSFKDTFTKLMQDKFKDKGLKTITVKTNYNQMPDSAQNGGINMKVANKLCNKTFSFVGLKETVYV